MRRPPMIAILTVGACALGVVAPSAAQTPPPQAAPSSAGPAGLRYLTWPGSAYRPASVAPASGAGETAPLSAASTPTRPPIIPHGGQPAAYGAAPIASIAPRQGLTPASAWIGSQAPAYAPHAAPPVEGPGPQPYYASSSANTPTQTPWRSSRAVAPVPAPAPAPAPSGYFAEAAEAAPPSRPVVAPAPAPARAYVEAPATAAPVPAPPSIVQPPVAETAAPPPADPMAPRRDALIFSLQRPAAAPAEVAPTSQPSAQPQPQAAPVAETAGAQGGARYYSVHRQAGRQPDATPLPAPVYLDALPVDLTTAPASPDLAEPPAAPNLIRNANGRIQALPANEDPTLP